MGRIKSPGMGEDSLLGGGKRVPGTNFRDLGNRAPFDGRIWESGID